VQYKESSKPPKIGNNAIIRCGTVIYDDVEIGDRFRTGHYVLIREQTRIGNNVLVGTMTVIDGYYELGNNIKIQTGVYIPKYTIIGNNVFIGPRAVLTNITKDINEEAKPTSSTG